MASIVPFQRNRYRVTVEGDHQRGLYSWRRHDSLDLFVMKGLTGEAVADQVTASRWRNLVPGAARIKPLAHLDSIGMGGGNGTTFLGLGA